MVKILLIEDDVTLLQEVTEWLTFEGYTVTGASTGTDGVKMALQELPDLIVSDIMLPGIDGYRVLLELRKHHQTALIPFIFTSALSEHQNIRFGMELGADDYITKPFSSAELLGAVQSRLEKQKLAQQKIKSDLDNLRTSVIRFLPHELRTPLVGIMGAAELMTIDAEVITPNEIKEMAEVIAHSGRRLLRLVENFSIYSELELKKTISTKSIVSHPEVIIEKICQNLRVEYKRTGDINWTCRREALAITEDHFKKIVYELVDNAFKFSVGGSLVWVTGHIDPGFFKLTVQDRGCGFNLKNMDEIGAFTQFDRNVNEQQGSGLGLIIVKRIVELSGGKIAIESQPQYGTRVIVHLPIAVVR